MNEATSTERLEVGGGPFRISAQSRIFKNASYWAAGYAMAHAEEMVRLLNLGLAAEQNGRVEERVICTECGNALEHDGRYHPQFLKYCKFHGWSSQELADSHLRRERILKCEIKLGGETE